MQQKAKYTLIAIFVIAAIGVLSISYFSRREPSATGDLYGAAMHNLTQTDSASIKLIMDTFIKPPAGFGAEGGLLNSVDIPIKAKGLVQLSYPPGGLTSASIDVNIISSFGNINLLTLRGLLTPYGQMYAQLDNLPEELNAEMNLAELNGAWFSVDDQAIGQLLPWSDGESSGQSASNSLSANEFKAALAGIFVPYRRYEDTVLNGRAAAHYEMAVDNERMTDLLVTLVSAARGEFVTPEERTKISGHVAARRWLAEAWIDTVSEQVLEIKLGVFPDETEEGMPMALSLQFDEFGLPLDISEPESASPLSVVLIKALRPSAGN